MNDFFENDIKQCNQILKEGGVILYPTDTIWGLGCDASNKNAIAKIYQIKKRIESKSLIALLPESLDLLHYTANPIPDIDLILDKFADKPTTIIYPNALQIADNAMDSYGSMAFRICKEPFCFALLKRFRKSIISTSANISGEEAPSIFKNITDYIKESVDYIVQYRQNDTTIAQPSRIIKLENNTFEIIRN